MRTLLFVLATVLAGTTMAHDIGHEHEHVDYVGELVGREHTCYGSDYSYMYKAFLQDFIAVIDKYPPEKGFAAPTQNSNGGDIWGVARVLEDKYEWSEEDIRGFLGENLMRVYEANWE